MTNQHPITPPPELVDKLFMLDTSEEGRLIAAYRAGADQELETILEMVGVGQQSLPEEDRYLDGFTVASIRAARRPKPPSLKEQALKELRQLPIDPELGVCASALDTIRRALEALDD
jgi:hypothetical protein